MEGNNEKIKQVISSLQKETREIGNIYGNSRIHSSYFWRTLAHLGFNSTNDDFDYSSHAPLLLLLFDVMSLGEQANVLSAFFHRYKTEISSGEKSDLENHVDWLSHDSNYKNLVEQMSYKYGYNLAFYINNYPKHFSSVSQEYVKIIQANGGNLADAIGIPEDMLRQAAKMAVCKINIDSDLRLAMTAGIREYMNANPKAFDPRQYLTPARAYIKELVSHKITEVLGSDGKAF